MTLDNMTGITEGSYTGFCKSQLITCNFVKACNGVCPFEDALKHADKEMNEQHTVDHDKEWIIGCIKHDGFISRQDAIDAFGLSEKTRKYGGDHSGYDTMMLYEIQDVLESLPSADRPTEWIPCSEKLPKTGDSVLVTYSDGEVAIIWSARPKAWVRYIESNNLIYPIAWMLLPKPYKGAVK